MKTWIDLYRSHGALRSRGREAVSDLRRVLRAIGEQHPSVFDKHVHQRLQPAKNMDTDTQVYRLGAEGPEYVATWNLAEADQERVHLREAHLTVLLTLDSSSGHLREMTLMVEGKRRNGEPWALAVHLPDDRETRANPDGDRQGHGAGGHAALHCHLGPTLDEQPRVRAPLPPVSAGALLSWLMSQAIPTLPFEPAPWPNVLSELAKMEG